jgi:hypothetical protein
MNKEEFMEAAASVFKAFGCKKYKNKFVYDHEDMYITFMLTRSSFSESYYHDIHCTIKALHPEIRPSEIRWKDSDFLIYPRFRVTPPTIATEIAKFDAEKYKELLQNNLEPFLKEVNKKGLLLFKECEEKRKVRMKEYAKELLSKY